MEKPFSRCWRFAPPLHVTTLSCLDGMNFLPANDTAHNDWLCCVPATGRVPSRSQSQSRGCNTADERDRFWSRDGPKNTHRLYLLCRPLGRPSMSCRFARAQHPGHEGHGIISTLDFPAKRRWSPVGHPCVRHTSEGPGPHPRPGHPAVTGF